MEISNITEKEIARYLKDINKALVCRNAETKKMLVDLKESILSYCEENPAVSIVDIKKHFGEPNKIAEEFVVGFDDNYIKKYHSMRKLKIALIVILTVILLFIGTLTTIIAINNHKAAGFDMEVDIKYEEIDQ